ncbi:DNA-binding domain-containing protein [Methylacidimicrobium sp. B4]|uniref:HvfC/BufC N-terminal domain-containing protein n=1 Tax=Methylacidimicrobium sp. B4 TaxID=2796139 RepID=UPI001A8C9B93|nr:DNA-binding domain-containing protein [Methylacidimicrobium sp. B4]QSR85286.1 putative DNA-binding domain-containing protein [Methylacidimicrobium sp. B4]
MKPTKPTASSPPSPRPLPRADSLEELRELQRLLFSCLTRPLGPEDRVQGERNPEESLVALAARLIRPSDRLAPFDRLEIYHRQYWLRLREALSEDYPALERLLGTERFRELAHAYFLHHPPRSPMLREIGSRLPRFLREEPDWAAPLPHRLVVDLARFEWAKISAFHAPEHPLPRREEMTTPEIRLFLQPHLSLLDLRYPVEAESPEALSPASAPLPKPRRVVVHRQGATVYHKLLPPEAFFLLGSFAKGLSLLQACERTAGRFPRLAPERARDWLQEWSSLGWLTTSPSPRASKTS